MGEEKEIKYPLNSLQSSYQQGQLITHQDTRALFIYKCRGYERQRLGRSLDKLINRHEMLRAKIIKNEIVIADESRPEVQWLNYRDKSEFEINDFIDYIFKNQTIDKSVRLIKFYVIERTDDEAMLITLNDGIIMDGQSHIILLKDLEAIYQNKEDEVTISYQDFLDTLQIQRMDNKADYAEAKQFWDKNVKSLPDAPLLPEIADINRKSASITETVSCKIPGQVIKTLNKLAGQNNVSLFAILLTLYGKVLSLYADKNDFVLNLPRTARPWNLRGVDRLIGLCSDFQIFSFSDLSEKTLLEEVKKNHLQLLTLQDYSEVEGVEILKIASRNKQHQVSVPVVFTSLLDFHEENDVFITEYFRTQTTQVQIETILGWTGSDAELMITYAADMYQREIIQGVIETFVETLTTVSNTNNFLANEYNVPLRQIDKLLIDQINSRDENIIYRNYIDVFSRNCTLNSGKCAISHSKGSITYGELENRVKSVLNFFANAEALLPEKHIIGIYLEKGYEQIICALAAVCGGYAYMPIERELPIETVVSCAVRAGVSIVITDAYIDYPECDQLRFRVLDLEQIYSAEDNTNVRFKHRNLDDTFVIINTSGSTGEPKGIALSQKGVLECFELSIKQFGFSEEMVALGITNFAHDMAIFDTLGVFYIGGTLAIPASKEQKEPEKWIQLMARYAVNSWVSVPAFVEMILLNQSELLYKVIKKLKHMLLGGDWVKPDILKSIKNINPDIRLFSVGGPSETTIWNISHEITDSDIENGLIPYGIPFPNTKYWILDENLRICPVGVKGTMYIEGKSLSLGYVGLEDENFKKFITWYGRRLYNTGDLGRYLKMGEIQILGRSDFQVKINGKRVELTGIENVMDKHNLVNKSAVIFSNKSKQLVAFFTSNICFNSDVLKTHCEKYLPDYMVPNKFFYLHDIPLTYNGKTDRKNLEKILNEDEGRSEVAATSESSLIELDNKLLLICKEILDDQSLTLQDNFYAMGGESVAAMKLIARIKDDFNVELAVYDILNLPFISEWRELIVKQTKELHRKAKEYKGSIDIGIEYAFTKPLCDSSCLLSEMKDLHVIEKFTNYINNQFNLEISKYMFYAYPYKQEWRKIIMNEMERKKNENFI